MKDKVQGRANARGKWAAGSAKVLLGVLLGLGAARTCKAGAAPAPATADRPTTPAAPATPRPLTERPMAARAGATNTAATHTALSEREKIEALLRRVVDSHLIFIRNGTEYSSDKAASHLRRKWNYVGDRVKTARQFIDYLASGSSRSGKPYQVRLSDGQTLSAHDWLYARLAELEAPAQAKAPAARPADRPATTATTLTKKQ